MLTVIARHKLGTAEDPVEKGVMKIKEVAGWSDDHIFERTLLDTCKAALVARGLCHANFVSPICHDIIHLQHQSTMVRIVGEH